MTEPLFRRIQADEIDLEWEFVGRGLAEIVRRCPTVPWDVEDVHRRLVAGSGALFVRPDGFIVLERSLHYISGRPFLNVWLMWFEPNCARSIRDDLIAWLREAVIATHSEWCEFSSPREAWGPALEGVAEEVCVTWRIAA